MIARIFLFGTGFRDEQKYGTSIHILMISYIRGNTRFSENFISKYLSRSFQVSSPLRLSTSFVSNSHLQQSKNEKWSMSHLVFKNLWYITPEMEERFQSSPTSLDSIQFGHVESNATSQSEIVRSRWSKTHETYSKTIRPRDHCCRSASPSRSSSTERWSKSCWTEMETRDKRKEHGDSIQTFVTSHIQRGRKDCHVESSKEKVRKLLSFNFSTSQTTRTLINYCYSLYSI